MEIIEFYGRTIRVKDISFCEKRRTRTSEVVSIIWNIIGIIGIIGIIFGIYFYDISTHIYDIFGLNFGINVDDIFDIKYSHVFTFLVGYIFLHRMIGVFIHIILERSKIIVIVLVSGEKIKSSYISDSDALLLNTHISKILKGEKKMSIINIGGFNLDSNEIIDVTCKDVWYKSLLMGIGSFMLLGFILMIIGAIFISNISFWKGILGAIFYGILGFLFAYLSTEVFNHSKITVKTMSSGEIKIHTKVFDEDDDFFDYYEELKTYV